MSLQLADCYFKRILVRVCCNVSSSLVRIKSLHSQARMVPVEQSRRLTAVLFLLPNKVWHRGEIFSTKPPLIPFDFVANFSGVSPPQKLWMWLHRLCCNQAGVTKNPFSVFMDSDNYFAYHSWGVEMCLITWMPSLRGFVLEQTTAPSPSERIRCDI